MSAPRRVPLALPGVRGFATRPLPDELERLLARWAERGTLEGASPIKAGRVWRFGDFAIKRFAPPQGALGHLRVSPARRAALLHARIRPVRSPEPVCVLERPLDAPADARRAPGESLLVSEFVAGRFLHELWDDDPRAVAALPDFVAGMHRARVFHGDLHSGNMIWDGSSWHLIDLEGLRHPLRTLWRKRLILDHWGRLHFALGGRAGFRAVFDAYLARMGLGWDERRAFAAVERNSKRVRVERLGPD